MPILRPPLAPGRSGGNEAKWGQNHEDCQADPKRPQRSRGRGWRPLRGRSKQGKIRLLQECVNPARDNHLREAGQAKVADEHGRDRNVQGIGRKQWRSLRIVKQKGLNAEFDAGEQRGNVQTHISAQSARHYAAA